MDGHRISYGIGEAYRKRNGTTIYPGGVHCRGNRQRHGQYFFGPEASTRPSRDARHFQSHYPNWTYRYTLQNTLEDIVNGIEAQLGG